MDLWRYFHYSHPGYLLQDYLFKGMTDLQERGDLWKWDLYKKTWSNIKTKLNPGPLHSHSCCKLPSTMIIFGGERNGEVCNDLWKFNFGMSYTFRLSDIVCLLLRFRH